MLDRGEALRKLTLNLVRYSGLGRLAGPLMGGVGAILMLHRVTGTPGATCLGINRHLAIAPAFLDALIVDLKRSGYLFVSMDEAIDRLSRPRSGGRFAAMTADDAYRDNLVEALPILEKHDVPCTIYVAPGLIGGAAALWWDMIEELVCARDTLSFNTEKGRVVLDCSSLANKRASHLTLHNYLAETIAEEDQQSFLKRLASDSGADLECVRRNLLMDWNEVRLIADHPLITIGAHTVNHYNLKRLDAERALVEMADSAAIIEAQLGRRPIHLAYPYGYPEAVGSREVDLAARAGFASAVTTRHGVLRPEHASHPLALPRISINGRYQRTGHVRTMLSGVTTPLANSGRMLVTV